MRLRFRIRTLMLVVAGVACLSAVLVNLSESRYLLIPLIPAIGPLIGATWVARRYEPGRIDPISGGLAGGAVQVTLILGFVAAIQFINDPMPWWWWVLDLGPVLLAVLGVHGVYGLFVGLPFSWFLASRAARKPIGSHRSPSTDDQQVRIAHRGFQALRAAEDGLEDATDSFHELAMHLHLMEDELRLAIHHQEELPDLMPGQCRTNGPSDLTPDQPALASPADSDSLGNQWETTS